ncbi:unnamed protein product [Cunninghamella blakesleeana]
MMFFRTNDKIINLAQFAKPVKLHCKENYYNYYRQQQQNRFNKFGKYNHHYNNNNNNYNNNNNSDNTNDNNANNDNNNNNDINDNNNKESNVETISSTDDSSKNPNVNNKQQQQQRYEKYQHGPKTGADTSLIAPMGGATKNKQMLFKKRIKQIYLAKDDTRELKEQERRPWILEDYDGQNSFTGTLEGGQGSEYVVFILTDSGFKVVPLDRWYKFQQKRNIRTLTSEEVEEAIKKEKKAAKHEGNRWMMLKHGNGGGDSEEDAGSSSSRRFKIVDSGSSKRGGGGGGGGSDDEGKRDDSDIDDIDFDDVFQDDEEGGNDHEMEDEDVKDGRERIKKEIKGYGGKFQDEEDLEEDAIKLTSEGKQMRKLVRDLEKNRAYESDEDKDPYASSEEELETDSEEEKGSDNEDKSKQEEDSTKSTPSLKKKTVVSKTGLKKGPKGKESLSKPIGRPGSPSLQHNMKSSTSRKEGSPIRNGSLSPKEPSSPPSSNNETNVHLKKRKIEDSDSQPQQQSKHQRIESPKHHVSSSSGGSDLITEQEVINVLRGNSMTTRDFLMRFRKRIKKNERNREIITALLKRVARHNSTSDPNVKVLELKPEFQ